MDMFINDRLLKVEISESTGNVYEVTAVDRSEIIHCEVDSTNL
jgi:hypothetical protein